MKLTLTLLLLAGAALAQSETPLCGTEEAARSKSTTCMGTGTGIISLGWNPPMSKQERGVYLHGHHWTVKYAVDMSHGFVPAVAGPDANNSHYDAKVTVFLDGSEPLQIGKTFDGMWTDKGCFEDDPATLVEKALDHDHSKETK